MLPIRKRISEETFGYFLSKIGPSKCFSSQQTKKEGGWREVTLRQNTICQQYANFTLRPFNRPFYKRKN